MWAEAETASYSWGRTVKDRIQPPEFYPKLCLCALLTETKPPQMASSQHLLPSFSSPATSNHDSTRSHLLSSSLWASPITISSFSSSPKLSPLLQTRRRLRLRVTAMAPPKPGGKAKKVVGMIKLALEAGKATPAPPVGPALGSKGVNIMAFCKDYNARTADKAGYIIPVEITVYDVSDFLVWFLLC